jgi:hypothetical protein
MPRLPRRSLALLAAALVAAGCGSISLASPPPTPTDFPGLTGRLSVAGITVSDWVSGDPGCVDDTLRSAAISFKAAGLDQAAPVKLYLYIFRNRAAWDKHRADIGPCAQSFVTDAQTFGEIEQSPYVVAGQGPWATRFETTLRQVLADAAGTGG